jgi:hypothetical protein
MRFPHVRFTIRRMLTAIAVFVVVLAWLAANVVRDLRLSSYPSPVGQAVDPSPRATASQAMPASPIEWSRYDDERLSAEEGRAIRAATEAIIDPRGPRPNLDETFRYDVSKEDYGWSVMVWRIVEFRDGLPVTAPGAHTGVLLDRNFKVTRITGGE